jgi:hypothetical protein
MLNKSVEEKKSQYQYKALNFISSGRQPIKGSRASAMSSDILPDDLKAKIGEFKGKVKEGASLGNKEN